MKILSVRHGREKHFRVRAADWQFLLPPPAEGQNAFPRWVDWMPLFSAITRFTETLALPGIALKLRTTPDLRGADLIQSLLADLDSLLGYQARP